MCQTVVDKLGVKASCTSSSRAHALVASSLALGRLVDAQDLKAHEGADQGGACHTASWFSYCYAMLTKLMLTARMQAGADSGADKGVACDASSAHG